VLEYPFKVLFVPSYMWPYTLDRIDCTPLFAKLHRIGLRRTVVTSMAVSQIGPGCGLVCAGCGPCSRTNPILAGISVPAVLPAPSSASTSALLSSVSSQTAHSPPLSSDRYGGRSRGAPSFSAAGESSGSPDALMLHFDATCAGAYDGQNSGESGSIPVAGASGIPGIEAAGWQLSNRKGWRTGIDGGSRLRGGRGAQEAGASHDRNKGRSSGQSDMGVTGAMIYAEDGVEALQQAAAESASMMRAEAQEVQPQRMLVFSEPV
jgi:hypothetical protein